MQTNYPMGQVPNTLLYWPLTLTHLTYTYLTYLRVVTYQAYRPYSV